MPASPEPGSPGGERGHQTERLWPQRDTAAANFRSPEGGVGGEISHISLLPASKALPLAESDGDERGEKEASGGGQPPGSTELGGEEQQLGAGDNGDKKPACLPARALLTWSSAFTSCAAPGQLLNPSGPHFLIL